MADLVLRGREIRMLEESGREYVLARIPDHLTPEEWGWLYDPEATLGEADRD